MRDNVSALRPSGFICDVLHCIAEKGNIDLIRERRSESVCRRNRGLTDTLTNHMEGWLSEIRPNLGDSLTCFFILVCRIEHSVIILLFTILHYTHPK